MDNRESKFLGNCMGVTIRSRGDDGHIMFSICVADDGHWHEKLDGASSYWLDELIEKLEQARAFMRTQEPDVVNGKRYGYKFRGAKSVTKSAKKAKKQTARKAET